VFATRTDGTAAGVVVMQGDGNLVLYSNDAPLFHTRTHGNDGAFVVMQDDCNLVVYAADETALWASRTTCD
jgi:hypothetical protein